jgi:cation diffusion facilitator family transporter
MAGSPGSIKPILYALAANTAIAIAKGGAAAVTGSGAMLAEAVHSIADAGNQILLLLGLRLAKRPPSADFPLGYGKEIYFWSFIVAIMLFSVGGLFSINAGMHKLANPEPLTRPGLALGVLIFAFFAEGGALFGCVREINKVRGERTLWQWFRHSRQSELIVIFGEDLAALLGLSAAIAAVAATAITGDPLYDALGSIAIGVLLVVIAVLIGAEIKDLLIGQGVDQLTSRDMRAFLEEQQEIETVLDMVTLQMGNDAMVAIKARMSEAVGTQVTSRMINRVESAFRERYPQVQWLFFEPDIEE